MSVVLVDWWGQSVVADLFAKGLHESLAIGFSNKIYMLRPWSQ